MNNEALINGFEIWCYRCLDIIRGLPLNGENRVYTNQSTRSYTSSSLNYKAVGRAKSTADMIYKLKIQEMMSIPNSNLFILR